MNDRQALSVTKTLASFVASAQPPREALEKAARAYLDTIGVTLAGSVEPSARLVRALVAEESPDGPARIVGTTESAGPGGAALANGTAAHALDFDDTAFLFVGHPSAPLVAATLAAGELANATGRTLLDAYCVGFEVDAVLGSAMNPAHYRRGWHCTSTIGSVGAAAAVARVLALDAGATAHGLAIGASLASGLKANFGTMSKPLHVGLAARNGVQAALLAARGFTASENTFDGPQGFLFAFDAERSDVASLVGQLGQRWEIIESGFSVKLYPSCAATHPTLDTLLDFRNTVGFSAADVESVDIGVDAMTPTVLLYDRPRTGLEGKFSIHYCAAAALVHGAVTLETFDDARVVEPEVQALLPRITMHVEPSLDPAAPPLTPAAITVRLRDGRELHRRVMGARGYPDRPPSVEELEAKFRACARRALPAPAIDRALDLLRHFQEISSVRSLTDALRGTGRSEDLRHIRPL